MTLTLGVKTPEEVYMGKKCRRCGCELVKGVNWYNSAANNRDYICKKCEKERTMKYQRNKYYSNPEYRKKRLKQNAIVNKSEKAKIRARNWRRKTTLTHKGKKIYGLMKREYMDKCELCGKTNTIMGYHHWDDSNPNLGVWVCNVCHFIIETYDRNNLKSIITKYAALKKKIQEGS